MRRVLSVALGCAWIALSPGGSLLLVEAAARENFRTCQQSPFCRRYSKFVEHQLSHSGAQRFPGWHVEEFSVRDDNAVIVLANGAGAVSCTRNLSQGGNYTDAAPRIDIPDTKLAMVLELMDSGAVRVRLDEIGSPKERYHIPRDDVILDSSLTRVKGLQSRVKETENELRVSFNSTLPRMPLIPAELQFVPTQVDVAVTLRPFAMRLYNNGQLVLVLNHDQLMNFETFRTSPLEANAEEQNHQRDATGIDGNDLWKYRFRNYEEKMPEGPRAIGVDIAFCNARSFHGLAEHSVDWDLPHHYINERDTPSEPYRFWNSDVFAYELHSPMGIYASIPLLHAVEKHGDLNYKVASALWLNGAETYVKLDRQATRVSHGDEHCLATRTWWTSETGALDVFLMTSQSLQDATRQYHALTGLAPLPKVNTLGLHQSRWQYNSEAEVESVNSQYNLHNLPLDYVWLDIDHTVHRKYSVWDTSKFPDPQKMTNALAAEQRDMVVIVDPHIKAEDGYALYDSVKGQHVLREASGNDFRGWCWPGDSAYMDVLSPEARALYTPFYQSFPGMGMPPVGPPLPDQATAKWLANVHNVQLWVDMNEPSVFNAAELTVPRDVLHLKGTVEHRAVHNLYGFYYHRATYEALLAARRDDGKRQMVLTRAAFPGSHRYGPLWTGDNAGRWDHMQQSIPMLLHLHSCGYSNTGADIPGFFDNPTPELLMRWTQLGIWYPFMRYHGALDTARREPYLMPNEERTLIRHALALRYRLMPFWYSVMAKHSYHGLPAWSSTGDFELRQRRRAPTLNLDFSLKQWQQRQDGFVVGETFFVRPISHPASEESGNATKIQLPGPSLLGWYDLHTLAYAGHGGSEYKLPHKSYEESPVFAVSGAGYLTKERFRRSVEAQRFDPLTLNFFVDPRIGDSAINNHNNMVFSIGVSYFDDGQSLDAIDSKNHVWVSHRLAREQDVIVINQRVEGSRDPKAAWRSRINSKIEAINIVGLPWTHMKAVATTEGKLSSDPVFSKCRGPRNLVFKTKDFGLDATLDTWTLQLTPITGKEAEKAGRCPPIDESSDHH